MNIEERGALVAEVARRTPASSDEVDYLLGKIEDVVQLKDYVDAPGLEWLVGIALRSGIPVPSFGVALREMALTPPPMNEPSPEKP